MQKTPSQIAVPSQLPALSPAPNESVADQEKNKLLQMRSQIGPNAVEFTVHQGLAIAFGDVMLGKLPEGSNLQKGYFEARNPQNWDRPEIAYIINADLPDPSRVQKAIDYFNQHTPVRFVPLTQQTDALVFEPGPENCYSYLGRVGGMQPITLSPKCQWQEIAHEIMHALGFIHEQSRMDRDQFIDIVWENIEPQFRPQFNLAPESFMEALKDSEFDYQSLMLYEPYDFSIRSDLVTMRSRTPVPIAPKRYGLSASDLRRLQRLYGP